MSSRTEEALATRRRSKSAAEAQAPDVLFFPENSRAEWLVTLAVFVVSCTYLRLFRDVMTFNLDEGVSLQGAARILHGQVLYRDFFSFLTPGSFYWTALFFRIFGASIPVARTLLVVCGGLYSSLTYLITRRVCSRWTSFAAAYLVLISTLPSRFIAMHNWDSTLWALVAIYSAVLFLQTGRPLAAFATGTFTAWTFLFEQSKGACLGLALFIAFAWIAWLRRESPLRAPSRWFAAAGGFLWPFLLVIAYWAHCGALGQMWNDWLWPIHHYTTANAVSYGTIFTSYQDWNDVFENPSWTARGISVLVLSPCYVIDLLPIFALGALFVGAREMFRERGRQSTLSYYFLVSAVVCGVALSVVISRRADVAHLIWVGPVLFLMLPWLIHGSKVVRWVPAAGRPALKVFLLGSFSFYGLMLCWSGLNCSKPIESRRGTLEVAGENGGLSYLMAYTHSGGKVFIYPYSPLLNFLTDTYSPARFDYLQPGMHTSQQFEESVHAVRADRTPLVLYDLSFFANLLPDFWPSTPAEALAEEPIRNLLISTYHPCAVVGSGRVRFVAFWRKDLPCPPNPTP